MPRTWASITTDPPTCLLHLGAFRASVRGTLVAGDDEDMNPRTYLKAVFGAVGANVFPPIAEWAVSYIPAPDNVHQALVILIVALLTGGAVYATPNKDNPPQAPK